MKFNHSVLKKRAQEENISFVIQEHVFGPFLKPFKPGPFTITLASEYYEGLCSFRRGLGFGPPKPTVWLEQAARGRRL